MIEKLCHRWETQKHKLVQKYESKHPESYEEILKDVVSLFADRDSPIRLDPKRITIIDHGNYQGTMLFVIGEEGYQPSNYYSVFVDYGSCTGCDTFQSLKEGFYCDYLCPETPNEEQAKGYMTLALHMFQSLTKIGGSE